MSDAVWRRLYSLSLGQLVSFLMALTSFSSSFVANHGVHLPLTLSFFFYLALALVYGSIMLYRRHKLMVPWYWYALLGLVDVHGNYLVNKSFQYSSITSVTILGCSTILWVLILTWLCLGTLYSFCHLFGAAISVAGLGLVAVSDARVDSGDSSRPLLGDVLVLAGTIFFALSNVGEEFCVKKKDWIEAVSMIGVFGALVSVCEIAVLERESLESEKWSAEVILGFAGFALSCFMFYSLIPFVLKMAGATMLNLSLLTSNMWAVAIRVYVYRQQVDWLYYISFVIVVIGLVTYSKAEESASGSDVEDRNLNHSEYHTGLTKRVEIQ